MQAIKSREICGNKINNSKFQGKHTHKKYDDENLNI